MAKAVKAVPGQHVCSLKVEEPQEIPPGGYHIVVFPYGDEESYDPDNMHRAQRGYGYPDPHSGLIHPAHDSWAQLYAMIQWESDDDLPQSQRATEYRDQFIRDPFGEQDTTCTEHRRQTAGMQCFAKTWGMFVHPDVPLALRVAHNGATTQRLVLAEFKLAYHL